MGHINQPGPTGQITRFLGLPLAYPLAYGGDHRALLLPRREDPSVANIIAGFCTTGFLPVSLFLEIMATGLKRKPPPPPEPHRTGMLVRLLAKILCLPSQTSFVTICFAFVLEFLPSNLPRFRRERIQRKARAGSPPLFADFEGYNGHDKISL